MPKTKALATRQQKLRRSSRLNLRHEGIKNDPVSTGRRAPQRKAPISDVSLTCTGELAKPLQERRRSQRITPAELAKRELALVKSEEEHRRRTEEQLSSIKKLEDEANSMLLHAREREARATLSQLEDHFTCALCYEILAHPYTLNPGQCGHTFCAICILKWFFSRLHKACGGWHESVDCPICRSLLVITPDRTPRLDITFPFVPNRIAATVLESLIEKLAETSDSTLSVKREDSEGLLGSGLVWDLECRKRSKSKDDEEQQNSDLAGWKDGGIMRAEWLKKDRDGKREMGHLVKFWTTMRSQDFVTMKQKLGV